MTGVGGRPEVIIEGANSKDGPWKEYEFLYKIGSLKRKPPVNSKGILLVIRGYLLSEILLEKV